MSTARTNQSPTPVGENHTITFLLVTGWLGCTLLLTGPGNLFLANSSDFTLGLRELYLFTAPLFVLGMIAAYALFLLAPRMLRPRLAAIFFALAALVWVQSNILIWNYGPLDGRAIVWKDFDEYGYLDLGIWIGVLVAAIWNPRVFLKPAKTFSAIVLIASLAILGISAVSQPSVEHTASI